MLYLKMFFFVSGTFNILFLVGVVLYYSYSWGININITDVDAAEYTSLALPSVYCLTGTLAMGLFIHNCLITIVKGNKNQKNNVSTPVN